MGSLGIVYSFCMNYFIIVNNYFIIIFYFILFYNNKTYCKLLKAFSHMARVGV